MKDLDILFNSDKSAGDSSKESSSRLALNVLPAFLLFAFGIVMLFIRIVPIYGRIFTDWPGDYGNFVNFSADDAVYHMRLVHNTLNHFPSRIFFDPFTYFPFGSYIAFGPLFTTIIATASLILGCGHPTPELINHVGAYTPPVMGALCLIPLYFATRELFGKTAAILAAFALVFLPGEFLSRSALGFTDHHVAEVLFSTMTCAFLIYALHLAESYKFNFLQFRDKANKEFIKYGIFTGISFGLFCLIWQGAQLFGGIFLIFFIAQLIIDNYHNKNADYLMFLALSVYLIPAVMLFPYLPMYQVFDIKLYPLYMIVLFPCMALVFSLFYFLHLKVKHNNVFKLRYIVVVAATVFLIILAIKIVLPHFYNFVSGGCKMLFSPTPGMQTVGEVRPSIINDSGHFSMDRFWGNLVWTLPLSIIGLGCLFCRIYKNKRSAEVFLFVWALCIIAAACAQSRFNYYLTIIATILTSLSVCYALRFVIYCDQRLRPQAKSQKYAVLIVLVVYTLLLLYPMPEMFIRDGIPSGVQIRREWYEALMWLKKRTPNPQGKVVHKNFDYKFGYYPIPKDLTAHYPYIKDAYGVMSWWDIGHQITYIAERIPNANNHQQGIVEENHTAGSALFFTATKEDKAVENLNKLGSRYVVIINDMALNQFGGIVRWSGDWTGWENAISIKTKAEDKIYDINNIPIDSPKFLSSMLNRFFYEDANGLQNFRLVYEDRGDYLVLARCITVKPTKPTNEMLRFNNYEAALQSVKSINEAGLASTKSPSQVLPRVKVASLGENSLTFAYSARPPVKGVKIFEKVAGATIVGHAPSGTQIDLTLKLITRHGRPFAYNQKTTAIDGEYKFVVPYPTTEMVGEGYEYDVKAVSEYQIKTKSHTSHVAVPEQAIMLGETIKIN